MNISPPRTRLKLNWELPTAKERVEFLSRYMGTLPFAPNESELETCAAYVLWGFDEDGKNGEQKGQYDLGRKRSSWRQKEPASLDEIVTTKGEVEILPQSYIPTKKTRQVFSREKTRKNAPSNLIPLFEALWKEIDVLDLTLCLYEQKFGKRLTPPRAELLNRLSAKDQALAEAKSAQLTSFSYLKERHHLIELRTQQYTLQDSYLDPTPRVLSHQEAEEATLIPTEIEIYPVLPNDAFFQPFSELYPKNFKESELRLLSNILWRPRDTEASFDFRKESNLLELLEQHQDFRATDLWKVFSYYAREANLTDSQNDLLRQKLNGQTNTQIAHNLNATYGSHYTDNYISTIYRKKIIPAIANAARIHRELLENLFFPENWKVCIGCGRTLLRSNDFFVKKKRASDGLISRCKFCDKKERARKKEVQT